MLKILSLKDKKKSSWGKQTTLNFTCLVVRHGEFKAKFWKRESQSIHLLSFYETGCYLFKSWTVLRLYQMPTGGLANQQYRLTEIWKKQLVRPVKFKLSSSDLLGTWKRLLFFLSCLARKNEKKMYCGPNGSITERKDIANAGLMKQQTKQILWSMIKVMHSSFSKQEKEGALWRVWIAVLLIRFQPWADNPQERLGVKLDIAWYHMISWCHFWLHDWKWCPTSLGHSSSSLNLYVKPWDMGGC